PGVVTPGVVTPGVATPGVATPGEPTPHIGATAPVVADLAAPVAAEPVYGLDASLTTPEAMHASDPPLAEPHGATTDIKPP
ncbi:MAG: hypothetical protein ABJD53_10485, partial [Gammaproteobacteria bacterium]